MRPFEKVLTFAVLAAGISVYAMPGANADAILREPVLDTTITQPAVVDSACCNNTLTQPAVIDTSVMTQPAVLDNSSCCGNVITQPAVIDNSCDACGTMNTLLQPAVIDSSWGYRRHHLLRLDTPFFGIHLF